MERDEINQALRDLGSSVDEKCPTSTFKWTIGIFVSITVMLIGGLYSRQITLAESVSSINTALVAVQKVSGEQGVLLKDISGVQNTMVTDIAVMAGELRHAVDAMKDISTSLKEMKPMSDSVVARIAREQIAWAKEREKKRGGNG